MPHHSKPDQHKGQKHHPNDHKDDDHDSHIPDEHEEQGDAVASPDEEQDEQNKPVEVISKGSSPSHTNANKEKDPKTSQLHFLVPASNTNIQLCYNLVSSASNRYPVPLLIGWNGKGLFSARKTHLAKLRGIEAYLDSLPKDEDKDLVLIVDGYDIIMQLPPEVIIARYFDIRAASDEAMAKRMRMSVEQAHKKGYRQTIFWGPDKICWPIDWNEPRCWAVPQSNLPKNAFGPNSGNGQMYFNDPRWLNSGTVIGPVADLRDYVHEAMAEINATYDKDFYASESDQYYLSNIWGRQEYYRSLVNSEDGQVPEETDKRRPPKLRADGQKTEFHIAIEYESSLFQTKAGYEPFFGYRQYDEPGYSTMMDVDMFDLGDDDFEAYDIKMPENVQHALTRIYDSIPAEHPKKEETSEWLANAKLGTNYVTKHIYAVWHCTGPKEWIDTEYPKLWFYPYASALVKAAIAAFQRSSALGDEEVKIDGRKWVAKTIYPEKEVLRDPLGGAWSDEDGGKWVNFEEICGVYYDALFEGDEAFKKSA